ncbi:Uncharacterised protein [uncultured Blautia sp.]|nr:Uncharacterised protein [uncultured Blautia sp.]
MGGLVIDLDGHLLPAIFDQEVGKPAVLINVGEGILRVEIAGFLGAEGVGEQFNEQILSTAARGGRITRHGGHLTFFQSHQAPTGENPAFWL